MAMKLQVLLLLLLCIASELTTHSVSNSLERCDAETEYNSYGYIDERKKALNDSSCTYQVVIGASCSSPNFTMGDIIIRFGDPLRNQVYEEKLIVPRPRTIEQCSRDIFQLNGACVSSICFVELYSYGAMDEFLTVGKVEGEADNTYGLCGKDGLKRLNCGER
ncbi:embryo-specific protein ATS3-like [Glycine soja]|uniref:embryo-specific protein ATS3-like n=1 Tax=Glycine soja TaxID=3848 RepID=UPI00103E4432|nr:embryo-specific protein ATS3-like [Glycine soja]